MSLTHHDGVSVYGSGLAFGKKNLEQVIVDCSGYTTSSLHIQAKSLDQVMTVGATTGIRIDAGTFSNSGWVASNLSTKLSTVLLAFATPVLPATGLAALASGFVSKVGVAPDGTNAWTLDFVMFANVSGNLTNGLTSAGTSSKIAWVAYGT